LVVGALLHEANDDQEEDEVHDDGSERRFLVICTVKVPSVILLRVSSVVSCSSVFQGVFQTATSFEDVGIVW